MSLPSDYRRIALITGASSGIGRTTCIALARAGWRLVLSGRRKEELEKTAELCAAAAKEAEKELDIEKDTIAVVGDVSKADNVKELFEAVKGKFGRLDMLFNNAGISGKAMPLEDLNIADYHAVMDINVTAAVLCTQSAIRIMKSQQPMGGRIINNGSVAAHAPRPDATSYTISKHAITGLTRSTSLDGRKYHIAACQIDIGNAATAMGGGAVDGCAQPDGSFRPEPVFDVQEVGNTIVHMASLPLTANVFNITLMATAMPYIGRG